MKDQIDKEKLPKHIAIIMDGNGRWAQKNSLPRILGHKKGVEKAKEIIEATLDLEIPYLSLFAFSIENWNRPKQEVINLFNLLSESIDNYLSDFLNNGIKLVVIGDLSLLDEKLRKKIHEAIEKTKNNNKLNLCVALSYSGRWDILQMVKKISALVKEEKLSIDNINYDTIKSYLTTSEIPDPDLLIRTSGELRISNFYLYQLAYTEIYVTNVLWPDFNKNEFYKCIIDFQKRERRFGLTSEQIKNESPFIK